MLRELLPRRKGDEWFVGRIALVTGAASGLGRGIALTLARAGMDLVVVDIDEAGLRETASRVEGMGRKCLAKGVDVSDRGGMEGLAREVLAEWGRVDVLVNNAGVGIGGELDAIPLDDLEWIVGVNLMGEVYGSRLFLPQMIARGEGHIVNVASLSALVVLPLHIAYTTTKFGLAGFTEALWAECRRHGIGVTLVCPGAVKSNIMQHTRTFAKNERQAEQSEKWGRMLQERGKEPEEAGRLVLEAIKKDRFLLLTGTEAYMLYYLRRLLPGPLRRVVAYITASVSRA